MVAGPNLFGQGRGHQALDGIQIKASFLIRQLPQANLVYYTLFEASMALFYALLPGSQESVEGEVQRHVDEYVPAKSINICCLREENNQMSKQRDVIF